MRNIKLIIEYDGTNYSGWQIQNNHKSQVTSHKLKTIQDTLEKTLKIILQEKVKVIASGRTDAGVHALAQVAHFKTHSKLPLQKIQRALNGLLPHDIRIKRIRHCPNDFHACYCVKSKIYRYIILNSKVASAFLDRYTWHITYALAIARMKREAKVLLGTHDFSSFCASGSSAKTKIRTIKRISIKEDVTRKLLPINGKCIIIEIEADGFLYTMMRTIVGTLVEIGRGRFEAGSLKKIRIAKDRTQAGPTAPAQGLFLVKAKY